MGREGNAAVPRVWERERGVMVGSSISQRRGRSGVSGRLVCELSPFFFFFLAALRVPPSRQRARQDPSGWSHICGQAIIDLESHSGNCKRFEEEKKKEENKAAWQRGSQNLISLSLFRN